MNVLGYSWRFLRRFKHRYDVFDASGQCAGNLRLRDALEYARRRRSLLLERRRSANVTIRKSRR